MTNRHAFAHERDSGRRFREHNERRRVKCPIETGIMNRRRRVRELSGNSLPRQICYGVQCE